jgi:AraC-like DNA-binding protein
MHSHPDFHELILVLRGGLEVTTNQSRRVARAGDVLFYPAQTPHQERGLGTMETLFVAFRSGHGDYPGLRPDRQGRVRALLEWMAELLANGGEELTLRSLMHGVLQEHRSPEPEPDDEAISLAKRYVRNHLAHPLSLEELASEVGMSKFHFARVFKNVNGQTPMRYVAEQRVEAARTLVLTTPATLRQIAETTGLGNEQNLSRVFQRVLGCTPGSLRHPEAGGAEELE